MKCPAAISHKKANCAPICLEFLSISKKKSKNSFVLAEFACGNQLSPDHFKSYHMASMKRVKEAITVYNQLKIYEHLLPSVQWPFCSIIESIQWL